MIQSLLAAIAAFTATNVDDLFILMVLFAQVNRGITRYNIALGQYLGIATLIIASLAGAFAGLFISASYIGLLGLFPVYLGAKKLWEQYSQKQETEDTPTPGWKPGYYQIFSVSTLTIANGGDNIGIYIPFFNAMPAFELTLTLLVFFILTAVWLLLAGYLAGHPALAGILQRYLPVLLPLLLIALGLYILWKSGTLSLVF